MCTRALRADSEGASPPPARRGVGDGVAHVAGQHKVVVDAQAQGLTLLHFSAHLKRILWDRGAIRGCLGGV